ncbi:hypothetical protein PSH54_19060 [Pseudoalteromonas sp. Angola-30]|uniref:hypothetical protein n=1 Tax=Pseudoalteromonas TaxID=53246 RepID=UPI0021197EF8|nr:MULTISPECIES: hypothetical protein [Pseudoalteromonas]MCQ8884498.1 hypothetical protein [Pseudoalteromonas agarivorans]MDC9527580.1 hypothetical protein [Pseudoalteromonas sp. Angola-30]
MSEKSKANDEICLSAEQKRESYIKYDDATKGLSKLIGQKADLLGLHGSARDGFVLDVANDVEGLRKRFVSQ